MSRGYYSNAFWLAWIFMTNPIVCDSYSHRLNHSF